MIAWSFRRLRTEVVAVAAALTGVGLLALITGRTMHHLYTSSGLSACLSARGAGSDCSSLVDQFEARFSGMQILIIPLVLLPVVFGAFVGGPLVAREVEAGTHRFFWTQGITRRRWLAMSSGAALVVAGAAGAVYSLIALAWLDVTNRVTNERFASLYDFQGLMPIASTLLATALGILAGATLRRTVPAMAATFVAFIAVRLPLAVLGRPHFASPLVTSVPFGQDDALERSGAWILSNETIDATGRVLGRDGSLNLSPLAGRCDALSAATTNRLPPRESIDACLEQLGVRSVLTYHPGGRFWTFQIIESGILVGIAGIALALAFVAVRRRIS
ncbi:MAG: hypothetical protein AB7L17_07260 [Ilumatobacteraceae bacterium]